MGIVAPVELPELWTMFQLPATRNMQNHQLNMKSMSFGLICSYFEIVWEQIRKVFTKI